MTHVFRGSLLALTLLAAPAIDNASADSFSAEVSCDLSTLSGNMAPGGVFVVHGIIYPTGTLQHPDDGFNVDGTPTYPELVIGTWSCWAINRSDNHLSVCTEGSHLLAQEVFEFDANAAALGLPGAGVVWTTGIDICEVGVPFERNIVGGTGAYRTFPYDFDVKTQTHVGMNNTGGSNFAFDFGVPPAPVALPSSQDGPSEPSLRLGFGRPDPFKSLMRFDLESHVAGRYRVDVFDVTGRRVRTLFEGRLDAGLRTMSWDGMNDAGRPVASGTYFYTATGPDGAKTERSTVLR